MIRDDEFRLLLFVRASAWCKDDCGFWLFLVPLVLWPLALILYFGCFNTRGFNYSPHYKYVGANRNNLSRLLYRLNDRS